MQCTNFPHEARCWHIMAHIGPVIKIWLDRGGEQNIIYFFHTPRQICYRNKQLFLETIYWVFFIFYYYFLTHFQPLSCSFHLIFAWHSWLRSWTELMFWLAFSVFNRIVFHTTAAPSVVLFILVSETYKFHMRWSPAMSLKRQRWDTNSL